MILTYGGNMGTTTLNLKTIMKDTTKLQISKKAFERIKQMTERYVKTLAEKCEENVQQTERKTIMIEHIPGEFDKTYKDDIVDILLSRFNDMKEEIEKLREAII